MNQTLLDYLQYNWETVLSYAIEHLYLAAVSVFFALLVAIPVGIYLTRREKLAQIVLGATGMIQTIPALALLAFMLPILGIGNRPAIAALFLYSLLPILRNTYTGIKNVEQGILEAGRGMGMTNGQLLRLVELPLAFAVIMAGIRIAAVTIIGWATLAAFIGGGGLGQLIFTGMAMMNNAMVLAGALPAALMAIVGDLLLTKLEKVVTPRGLQVEQSQ